MRYRVSNTLWGIFWIAAGILIAGKVLNFWEFSIFFDGWWTLFIIIPCAISIVSNGFGGGAFIGLIIGVLLLLSKQSVIELSIVRKLFVPIVLVCIGCNMIFKNMFNKSRHIKIDIPYQGKNSHAATFSSQNIRIPNEKFYGTELNSIFGALLLDLRDAVIDEDIVINATAIFGGIDIKLPENVRVKVSSTSLFGGVGNKKRKDDAMGPIVYINATCMFGGVDIK